MLSNKSFIMIFGISILSFSCANRPSQKMPSEQVRSELQKEIRLSDDNKELNDLRKSLPEQKRQDNDDLAFYLKQLQIAEKDPDRARSEFNQLIQKRREVFREKTNKLREKYSMEERKLRENFNAEQNKKREDLRNRKLKPKASQEEYARLGEEQRSFYASQSLRRKDFEAEVQAQTKDFDHMIRERQQGFAEQLRTFKKRERNTTVVPLGTDED